MAAKMEIPDKMGIAIARADLAQGGLIYMLTQQKLIVSLALVLFSVCVAAPPAPTLWCMWSPPRVHSIACRTCLRPPAHTAVNLVR